MTVTAKKLYGGTLNTTTSTVLYTAPTSTTTVVTSITVNNSSGSAATLTIALDGTPLYSAISVDAGGTWLIGPTDLRQVLAADATITGGASANSALNVRISGVEIS